MIALIYVPPISSTLYDVLSIPDERSLSQYVICSNSNFGLWQLLDSMDFELKSVLEVAPLLIQIVIKEVGYPANFDKVEASFDNEPIFNGEHEMRAPSSPVRFPLISIVIMLWFSIYLNCKITGRQSCQSIHNTILISILQVI